jgi:hypothetical protein
MTLCALLNRQGAGGCTTNTGNENLRRGKEVVVDHVGQNGNIRKILGQMTTLEYPVLLEDIDHALDWANVTTKLRTWV